MSDISVANDRRIKALYCGDSEVVINRYVLGVDVIEQAYYNDNGRYFRGALTSENGFDLLHLPGVMVPSQFPEELGGYDVIVLSDVGYNTFMFYPGFAPPYSSELGPDRTARIEGFAQAGGGFLMTGGYLSFSGLNGVAKWAGTRVEGILPVSISRWDDRVEVTEGFRPTMNLPEHPIVRDLPWANSEWKLFGYNRLTAEPGSEVVMSYNEDPILVCGAFGSGRTAAFASDFAPHWAGTFVDWSHYGEFWQRVVRWLAGEL